MHVLHVVQVMITAGANVVLYNEEADTTKIICWETTLICSVG